MPIIDARNACKLEFFHLKYTTINDGSYRERNIECNVSTIPVPFISNKDNGETSSAKCNAIDNIARILECTEFNLLKTKHRLIYLKIHSVPRCKHFSSQL
jgi:hypothetical protein